MEMEPQHDFTSTVDTSRPFTSVKEAVAIFGERLLLGEIYSPKPFSPDMYTPTTKREPSWRLSPPPENSNNDHLVDVIKKLEAELEQTKMELKLLKERGSETEVALATLNAELHKNMSKLAQAEAAAAGKAAAATTKTVRFEMVEDEKKKEEVVSVGDNDILSLGENDHLFGGKEKKGRKHKQKPIIPLVGDFFFKRKSSSTTHHHNPLYASPF
ncbi:WEB family protein At1g75720 [Cajanus cajan]|uniref:WEB family protein At1g75720 n=1 Tax=Cajanus cajan TaxID=3821 RepID=UPI00098D9268|nr:WEB family protein At1g75720 [Cajanus cajan]